MEIVRKNYNELPPTRAPHFQSVRAGNMLFLSGASARDTEAAFGDMREQTDVIYKRIKFILEAEGGSLENVVKLTQFVTENRRIDEQSRIRDQGEVLRKECPCEHTCAGRRARRPQPQDRDRSYSCVVGLERLGLHESIVPVAPPIQDVVVVCVAVQKKEE